MNPSSSIPTVRELIAEYAAIEERVRSVEARSSAVQCHR
jgi:hypothetical protein